MSKRKRNRYAPEFMAKVALEAIKGEATASAIASRFGVHPNLVMQWKRQAVEGMTDVFSGEPNHREASRVGGIIEIVRDGENGFLVPPGDPRALAATIGRAADESPDWAETLGAEARRTVERNFNIEDKKRELVLLFEDVCRRRGGGWRKRDFAQRK